MKFTIIATGYNCEKYVKECIDSVICQTNKNRELFVYNDGSTDDTGAIAQRYASEKVFIINNPINEGALKGRYNIIQDYATGDVVCFLGLDDYLQPAALDILLEYYDDEVQMTWGNWQTPSGSINIATNYPKDVWQNKSFRRAAWRATALNTFRLSLIKQVDKKYLLRDGKFLTNCTDLAYSFPCLEMIEEHEARVVQEHIYVYRQNTTNSTLNRFGRNNKTEIREYLKKL